MAELVLLEESLTKDCLPPLCMRCGQENITKLPHRFIYVPPSHGVWGALFSLLLKRIQIVNVPLCKKHRHMWFWRGFWIFLGLLLPFLCFLGILFVAYFPGRRPGQPLNPNSIQGLIVGLCTFGLLISLILDLVILSTWRGMAIRMVEIGDDFIVLEGVSPRFIRAMKKWNGPEAHNLVRNEIVSREISQDKKIRKIENWKSLGYGLLFLGAATMILPLMGLQFRAFANLGEYIPVIACIAGFSGAIILKVISRNDQIHLIEEQDQEDP